MHFINRFEQQLNYDILNILTHLIDNTYFLDRSKYLKVSMSIEVW